MDNNTPEQQTTPRPGAAPDEQAIVNRIAREFLHEQRLARRWGIGFKLFISLYLLSFFVIYLAERTGGIDAEISTDGHTALIDISGAIASTTEANADDVTRGLRRAFEDENTRGLIIRINSPGGSPVQSGYINDEIMRLKQAHPDIPVYAVIGDICASGGYYIASAADYIYADKASLVGSIGVIMAGFGFVEAIKKLGIERRVMYAGENKAWLDPFSPLKPGEVVHTDALLDDIYQQFVEVVKAGRGDRLADDEQIFSGLIWTGEQSVALGLVDGLGSPGYVARELINAEHIVDFSYRDNLLERFAKQIGASLYNHFMSQNYFQYK